MNQKRVHLNNCKAPRKGECSLPNIFYALVSHVAACAAVRLDRNRYDTDTIKGVCRSTRLCFICLLWNWFWKLLPERCSLITGRPVAYFHCPTDSCYNIWCLRRALPQISLKTASIVYVWCNMCNVHFVQVCLLSIIILYHEIENVSSSYFTFCVLGACSHCKDS